MFGGVGCVVVWACAVWHVCDSVQGACAGWHVMPLHSLGQEALGGSQVLVRAGLQGAADADIQGECVQALGSLVLFIDVHNC